MVVNGGYSAVSEAFYMRKPMIVIPVPGHAEQWVNARIIKEHGVGIIGSEKTLETDLQQAVIHYNRLKKSYETLLETDNGAKTAAD